MTCILCQQNPPIENSHIIPKLVYRRLKEGSPLNSFRHSSMFAKPIQDGWKADLLCRDCEDRFSRLETWFANEVYDPFLDRRTMTLGYDERLALFGASLHFRNVYFQLRENAALTYQAAELLCENLRKMCLNSEHVRAGVFQYIEFARPFANARHWPPGINSYVRRECGLHRLEA